MNEDQFSPVVHVGVECLLLLLNPDLALLLLGHDVTGRRIDVVQPQVDLVQGFAHAPVPVQLVGGGTGLVPAANVVWTLLHFGFSH